MAAAPRQRAGGRWHWNLELPGSERWRSENGELPLGGERWSNGIGEWLLPLGSGRADGGIGIRSCPAANGGGVRVETCPSAANGGAVTLDLERVAWVLSLCMQGVLAQLWHHLALAVAHFSLV